MRLYDLKPNETITDVALNATGSILAWPDIVQLNDLSDWSASLPSSVIVPEVIEAVYQNEISIYPACNKEEITDLTTKINAVKSTLNGVSSFGTFQIAEREQIVEQYEVKEGETISDVVLNSTGTINNWNDLLTANNLNVWNPILTVGQKLKVAFTERQKNVFKSLAVYPACNSTEINDLSTKIQDLINNFANVWILRTGFWDDSGLWVDSANWID